MSDKKKKVVCLTPMISVLPNDYVNLVNKPKINGIELSYDNTAKELNLLSADKEDYQTAELNEDNEGKYFLVIDEENNTMKIPVKAVSTTISDMMKTGNVIDSNAPIGTYQFIEKQESKN